MTPVRTAIIAVILGALAIGAYVLFTANSDKSGPQQSAAGQVFLGDDAHGLLPHFRATCWRAAVVFAISLRRI